MAVVAPEDLRLAQAEHTSLDRRFGALQFVRCVLVLLILIAALAVPGELGLDLGQVLPLSVAYLAISFGAQLADWWNNKRVAASASRRSPTPVQVVLLPVDSVYLAALTIPSGGTQSGFMWLFTLQLIAVTLLASPRTGVRLAMWDSALLLAITLLRLGGPLGHLVGTTDVVTPTVGAVAVRICGFWAVALSTAVFSALSERELRRSKAQLDALTEMASDMEEAMEAGGNADQIARLLLQSVLGPFGFRRVALIWDRKGTVMAVRAAAPAAWGRDQLGEGTATEDSAPGATAPGDSATGDSATENSTPGDGAAKDRGTGDGASEDGATGSTGPAGSATAVPAPAEGVAGNPAAAGGTGPGGRRAPVQSLSLGPDALSGSVPSRALAKNSPVLVRSLSGAGESVLDGVLPQASNVVVVPARAGRERRGVLVAESGPPVRRRMSRRSLEMVGRFAAHAALALSNADLREEVAWLAASDSLTGLANRRALTTALAREVARTARTREPLSLAVMDIDHFKSINDTFGHLAGDDVLREVASSMAGSVRDLDLVARYGGEEFAIVLPNCSSDDALMVVERVRAAVAHGCSLTKVTVSAGIATLVGAGGDGEALMAAADEALYASKRAGRDRASVAQPRVAPPAPARGEGEAGAGDAQVAAEDGAAEDRVAEDGAGQEVAAEDGAAEDGVTEDGAAEDEAPGAVNEPALSL